MKRGMKRFLTICGIVICAGIGLSLTGWLLGGTEGLSDVEEKMPWISFGGQGQEVRTLDVDAFSSIDLEGDMDNVTFVEDETFAVEMHYDKKLGAPMVKVKDGTLVIKSQSKKNWWLDFNIFAKRSYAEMEINIHYPKETAFHDIHLANDIGDTNLKGIEMENLTINADAGDVALEQITASGDICLDMDLGDADLKDIQTDTLEISGDSGDVSMERVAADHLKLDMDLGSVDGRDMRTKGADIQMDSGDLQLAGTLAGTTKVIADMGDCTLKTDLGKDTYRTVAVMLDLGDCSIDGKDVGSSYTVVNDRAKNQIVVEANDGDVDIDFR